MMPEPRAERATEPLPPDVCVRGEGRGAPPSGPPGPPGLFAWYAPGFSDALGDRLLLFDNTEGRPLELLRLRADFARIAEFEFSLRERAHDLAGFEGAQFARVCRVDRLPDPGGGLAIVSEHVEGRRLSEVLALVRQRRARLSADVALALIVDLVDALAAFHGRGPHLAHGAIGPDRLVLAPGGRILVTEYVLGLALRRVPLDRDTFWREMRIALPGGPGAAPFDQRTDVLQLALTALALLLGRALGPDDFPGGIAELVTETEERARLSGWDEFRWSRMRGWLDRALQRDPAANFLDAIEAGRALEEMLRRDGAYEIPAHGLARLLADCGQAASRGRLEDGAPVPAGDTHPALQAGQGAPALVDGKSTGEGDLIAARTKPVPQTAARATALLPAAAESLPLAIVEATDSVPTSAWHRLVSRPPRHLLIAVLVLVVVLEGLYIGSRFLSGAGGRPATTGALRLDSNPARAAVTVDGKPAGTTPVTVQLAPGRHAVELALGTRRRAFTVALEAGASVSQFLELPLQAAAAGQVSVRSEPAGARVTVDGQLRGVTPLVVSDLGVGPHDVRVERRGRSVSQTVNVEQATTAALFVPFAGGDAPTPGWLSISAPVELQIYEDSELVGTSRSERIMMSSGRHEISLVNDLVGFRTSREVQVPVGGTEDLEVTLPNGTVDINAAPWAEVWIDGEKVGETPLAGVPVRLGKHAVTFKHPTLGERTLDCVVTLRQPVRLSTDLRR
jgi:hypothetical protein